MSKDTAQEKTEQATPHRLQKALEEGKVFKSQELSSVGVLSLGFLALYTLGPMVVTHTTDFMRHILSQAPLMSLSQSSIVGVFRDGLANFFLTIGPFLVVMVVIGALVNVAQVGFRFSAKPLEPKFDKLDLVEGFKRFFKSKILIDSARDMIKIIVVCLLGYWIIADDVPGFVQLMDTSTEQFARQFGVLSLLLAMKISGALLVLAIFDYAHQRYQYHKDMRMTKQEIKEESKDTLGNPLLKSRIRQAQMEMSRQRMMQDVPTADVVVTNPTHFAVALKYDRETMDAPLVVAKGQRLIAQKIKEIAREAGVPIVENKPLARSLFKLCDIGSTVPAKLYKAVAEVLAYVYQLKGERAHRA